MKRAYRKEITVDCLGMVTASVYSGNRCCGLKHFSGFFDSNRLVEGRAKKAHEWADQRMRLCAEQETGIEP